MLGNHDYESNQQLEVRNILTGAGVTVLTARREVLKIGIAGVKGFAGGFGKRALGPWGEAMIKQFVHEAVNEAPSSRRRWHACAPRRSSRSCTTHRFSRPSKVSRSKSTRSSARAGWRSRSIAIP